MKFYFFPPSPNVRKVNAVISHLEIADVERQVVNLAKGEQRQPGYSAVNRQALVPTLELDGGTRLNQSLAIMEYLDTLRPQPALLPAAPLERARVRSLALLIACEIHPLNNLRVLQHLKRALGQSEAQIKAWYQHWVADGLAKFEAELAEARPAGQFCHGDVPGLADCCLVPQIFNARRYDCDLSPYPNAMRVFDTCIQLEAFDRAQPTKQPDAE